MKYALFLRLPYTKHLNTKNYLQSRVRQCSKRGRFVGNWLHVKVDFSQKLTATHFSLLKPCLLSKICYWYPMRGNFCSMKILGVLQIHQQRKFGP